MFGFPPLTDAVLRGAVLMPLALLWIVVLTRIVGLRSFSKMTAFDFVATVATGSLLANAAVATEWDGFVQPVVAITALFVLQFTLAWLRKRSPTFRKTIDNRPRILMRDGVFDEAALEQTRVARSDVLARLREANALERGAVRYVVLEATGDISVLHGDAVDEAFVEGLG